MTSEANVHPVDLPTQPASSANVSQHPSPLPQPRRRPLQPGGTKESELIRYLDHGVNQIQKRVDNRVTKRKDTPAIAEADGYRAFWEVAKDLDGLVDVVWVSGSRTPSRLATTFALLMKCSKPPGPIPAQPRCSDRRVPPTFLRFCAFYTGHVQAPLETRPRFLLSTHRPRYRDW
jgi:hypothetical protein